MSIRGDRPLRMRTPRSTSPALARYTAYREMPRAGGVFGVWRPSRCAHASGLFFANWAHLPSRKRLCRSASCSSAMRYTHSGHTSQHLPRSIPAPATEGGCCRNDLEGRIYATALGDNWLGASCARAHAVVVRAKTILGSRLPARLSRYGADICAFDARLAGADLLLIASVALVQIRFLEPVVRRGRRSKRRGSAASYS